MPVMNFDLMDGLPEVSFSVKNDDAIRFVKFMRECTEAIEKQRLQSTPATPPDSKTTPGKSTSREGRAMSQDQFYLQDSRSYVGNDMLFWAVDGKGYTTDIRKAEVYTKADAVAQHQSRETDIPWPKDYIDAKTRPAVDMQYVKRAEALAGTGIKLIKPKKPIPDRVNCTGCGKFIRAIDQYGDCPHCSADNRP